MDLDLLPRDGTYGIDLGYNPLKFTRLPSGVFISAFIDRNSRDDGWDVVSAGGKRHSDVSPLLELFEEEQGRVWLSDHGFDRWVALGDPFTHVLAVEAPRQSRHQCVAVNVGFSTITMACKTCGKSMMSDDVLDRKIADLEAQIAAFGNPIWITSPSPTPAALNQVPFKTMRIP